MCLLSANHGYALPAFFSNCNNASGNQSILIRGATTMDSTTQKPLGDTALITPLASLHWVGSYSCSEASRSCSRFLVTCSSQFSEAFSVFFRLQRS